VRFGGARELARRAAARRALADAAAALANEADGAWGDVAARTFATELEKASSAAAAAAAARAGTRDADAEVAICVAAAEEAAAAAAAEEEEEDANRRDASTPDDDSAHAGARLVAAARRLATLAAFVAPASSTSSFLRGRGRGRDARDLESEIATAMRGMVDAVEIVEDPRALDVRDGGAFCLTLVPIRPRRRGERDSLRTFPGVSLRPPPLAFNPGTPRRLSTPLLTPLNASTPTFARMERIDRVAGFLRGGGEETTAANATPTNTTRRCRVAFDVGDERDVVLAIVARACPTGGDVVASATLIDEATGKARASAPALTCDAVVDATRVTWLRVRAR